MTPRGPASSTSSCTSSAATGALTAAAALGAVRPQPVSNVGLSSVGIDADGEQDDPDETEYLERAVAQDHVLGRAALALLEEQRVPQHGQHERHDGQLRPDAVGSRVGPLE